jgi:hypothetical protein
MATFTGVVGGAGVDDDDLVDEAGVVHEAAYRGDDRADARLLVQRREHDADRGVALASNQLVERPIAPG